MNSQSIKVAHVTFDLTLGGTQQVIKQLVLGSDANICHSVICTDGVLGELGELLESEGIKVTVFNRQPGFDFSLVKQLWRYLKTEKIDILHCHQYSPYFYGVLATTFSGAKIIFTEHGRFYPDRGSLKRKLTNPLFSIFTDGITAISKATAAALVKFENFSVRNIDVVYNGTNIEIEALTDEDPFFGIANRDFVIGTIARLDPIKNHPMMIRAFAKFNRIYPDSSLLIIGDGPEMVNLLELVETLKLKHKVFFPGYIVKPSRYLLKMDLFTLPSFSEGTSMTILEAMSCGKPVVATKVGGSPEIVLHEKTGLIIDNDVEEQLVAAFETLYLDSEKRKHYGYAGKQRYLNNFTEQNMVQAYQAIYSRVLNR